MKGFPLLVLILSVALVVTVVTAVVLVIGLCTRGFGAWEPSVCHTRECVRASARITSYMDEGAEPCEDFYRYACGGFDSMYVIPPGGATVNPWSSLSAELLVKMKAVLESPSNIDHLNVVKQTKKYYSSCMNESVLEGLGVQPLVDYMKSKGGWALLNETWTDTDFDLESYIVKIGLDTMPSILAAMVGPNPNNSDQNIIHIGQGFLSLGNRDYYLKPKAANRILQMFEKTTIELAVLLGGEQTKVRPEIAKMIDFESELAKLTVPAADRQAPGNRRLLTVQQIKQKYVGLDIMKIVDKFFKEFKLKTLDRSSVLGVADDLYLKNVGDLLSKTPKRTLSTYVMFRGLASLLEYTDKKSRGIMNQMKTLTHGATTERPRYQVCAEKTNDKFPYVTARFFVDRYFKEGTSDIKDMTKRLKTVFEDNLEKLEWLDEDSRLEAKRKLHAMVAKLAYPDLILNNQVLENETFISDLQPDEYLVNNLKMSYEGAQNELRKLYKPVDKSKWPVAPVTVNAFYSPPRNLIVFPLGILQPPFYDVGGLKVLNYAAIGAVMGHEITHGFDNNGRVYDKDGNRREWMTQASVLKFYEKTRCIIDQYSNISIPEIGMKVNGKLTQGENIADVGAVKQAFQAYWNWVNEHGAENSLPGLDLSASKLFFLGYAQMYCHLITPELMGHLAQKDNHAPMKERVYGTLINSPDFSEVFQCALGSRMNPGSRCSIW